MSSNNSNPILESILNATQTTTTTSGQLADATSQQAALLNSFQLGEQVPQTKLIASLVLFVITLLSGYLPVRVIVNQKYIQHAMFAGGGVLMATAFCHLIPEAHEAFNKRNEPTAAHQHHSHVVLAAPAASNSTPATATATTTTTTIATPPNATADTGSNLVEWQAQLSHLHVPYPEVFLCCGFFFMYLAEQLMVRFINNHSHEHPCDASSSAGRLMVGVQVDELVGNTNLSGNGTPTTGTSTGNLSTSAIVGTGNGNSTSSSGAATNLYKFLRGFLIVSAFGAHSIFDGVAIGSQETVEKVWTIFAAISCHKLIIAAVVGLELYAATLESHLWTLVHLSIFSLMSPIGIVLVVVAQNSLNISSDDPTMILLQSFATGTLLYIIFVEVLQPKQAPEQERNKIGKSISLIAGFTLMLVVLTLLDA